MTDYAYALQLENGMLAILDYEQGTHAFIYSTPYIHLATMEQRFEDAEFHLEDFNKFLTLGTEGLFDENGCMYQYDFEFKIIGVIKIKLTIE